MRILQVDSSLLAEHSVSRRLTAYFMDCLFARHSAVECDYLDLDATPPSHLTKEDLSAPSLELEQFLAADLVVIGAPLYNLTVPSTLHAWLDRLVRRGETFEDLHGGRTRGLVSPQKRVLVLATRGAPLGQDLDLQELYLRGVFAFMGVPQITYLRAEGLAVKSLRPVSIAAVERQSALYAERFCAEFLSAARA